MSSPKDAFRQAIERQIWANSNLSSEDRAEVLRQYARELEGDDSRFDDMNEHVRTTLKRLGYELPEDGHE